MKIVKKVCFIVTVGVVIGLRQQMFRSKSHTIWQVVGTSVSQEILCPVALDSPCEVSGKSKKQKDVKEPLRTVVYLSCWGPYQ